MSRTRVWLFGLTLAVYVAIVVGVLTTSKLVTLDWQVMLWRPYKQWPQIHAFLDYFVVLGQRGPTAVMVLAWLGWRSWHRRTLHPLLVLGTSLLLLNVTVGAVKYGLGRLGPHYATTVGSSEMFAGGDIFPSGHTANAVVTWGVLAYLATTQRAQRLGSVVSALLALGVGATTVYLGTHWVSDVLLGWAAGLLILLALPWFEPAMAKAEEYLLAGWARLSARRRRARAVPSLVVGPRAPKNGRPDLEPVGAGSRGVVVVQNTSAPQQAASQQADAQTGPAAADGGPRTAGKQTGGRQTGGGQPGGRQTGAPPGSTPAGGTQTGAANNPYAPGRPPTGRNERTPLSPGRSRRPPVDRPIRPGAPLAHQPARGGRSTSG